MMRTLLDRIRSGYFGLGCAAIFLGVLALQGQLRSQIVGFPDSFGWQVVSGLILLMLIMYQWFLLIDRQFRVTSVPRKHYVAHRWMGVAATLLFSLHALGVGYGWNTVLAVTFFLVALSGLFNKEIVRYRTRGAYLTWLAIHIVLSVIMAPLIVIHIWVALSYQGI